MLGRSRPLLALSCITSYHLALLIGATPLQRNVSASNDFALLNILGPRKPPMRKPPMANIRLPTVATLILFTNEELSESTYNANAETPLI
jgi:hypothetical protein